MTTTNSATKNLNISKSIANFKNTNIKKVIKKHATSINTPVKTKNLLSLPKTKAESSNHTNNAVSSIRNLTKSKTTSKLQTVNSFKEQNANSFNHQNTTNKSTKNLKTPTSSSTANNGTNTLITQKSVKTLKNVSKPVGKFNKSDKKIETIDEDCEHNIGSYLTTLWDQAETLIASEYEKSNEETVKYLTEIYDEKIEQSNNIKSKYENDLKKLEAIVDLSDPTNVNNIIYNSVVDDRNDELNQIEQEFLIKKEGGLSKKKEKLKEFKENTINRTKNEKIEESKKNCLLLFKNTINKPKDFLNKTKLDFSKVDLNLTMKVPTTTKNSIIKKHDFNSTVNTTLPQNNSNNSLNLSLRNTLQKAKTIKK